MDRKEECVGRGREVREKGHSKRRGGWDNKHKITDQISIKLKNRQGQNRDTTSCIVLLYCFFFHTSYCVTQGITSVSMCVCVHVLCACDV